MHTSTKLESNLQAQDFTFFRYASSGMVLFTKAGYLMLTKTFRDDTAWDIQRQLVDYFTLEASTKRPVALSGIALQDTPSLPDGDHLRTAMALPLVNYACTYISRDHLNVTHGFYRPSRVCNGYSWGICSSANKVTHKGGRPSKAYL